MENPNTLYLIASCLNWLELARLSQVNKLCSKVCHHHSEFWQRECIRVYLTDLDLFQNLKPVSSLQISRGSTTSTDWKTLLKRTVCVQRFWRLAPSSVFLTTLDLRSVGIHVAETLKSPELPIPRLSREGEEQETVVQQLFADASKPAESSVCPTTESRLHDIMAVLDTQAWELYREVDGHVEEELLLRARWVLRSGKEPNAIKIRDSQATIIRLFYCLAKTVKTHCKLTLGVIDQADSYDSLIVDYCTHWAAYSAAIFQLEVDFRPFTDLFNEMYEAKWTTGPTFPKFSVVRLMTLMWRRAVFDILEGDLMRGIEELQREINQTPESDLRYMETSGKMMVFAQAMADLSVDEYTVHFLGHSLVELNHPYVELEALILTHTRVFYESLSCGPETCMKTTANVMRSAERMYLPVTCRKIEKIAGEKELKLWETYFIHRYKGQWTPGTSQIMTEDSLLRVIYSPFGQFISNIGGSPRSKANVRRFIDYMIGESSMNGVYIARFNDLSDVCTSTEKLISDELIEARTTRLPWIPSLFRSTGEDLTRTDLEGCRGLQDCIA